MNTFDCVFRRIPLGLKLQQDLKVIGFNTCDFQKQCLGNDVIRVGDFVINVNQRAVRNARSLFQLKLTPPIRIRFVRTKKKIKNTCFREQDRVVLYVPIMNTPLGFSLDDNGRIVGFNEDWQRRRVRLHKRRRRRIECKSETL